MKSKHPMSRLAATWLAAGALLLCAGATASPQVGQPAPGFSGIDTKGETWSLAGLQGGPVILEWTNHDCPYVRKHYDSGNMQTLQEEATRAGYTWLSVISSAPGKQGHVTAAEADRLTQDRGAAPSAVILDETGAIGRAYDARTTPHMYIIDEGGNLVYMGAIDDIRSADPGDIPKAKNHVRVAMVDVAEGRAPAEAVTRPYGCSVKY